MCTRCKYLRLKMGIFIKMLCSQVTAILSCSVIDNKMNFISLGDSNKIYEVNFKVQHKCSCLKTSFNKDERDWL